MHNRATLKAMNNPNRFHGAIESLFTGKRERNLWRIDTLYGSTYLLLLSTEKPDLTGLAEQFGPVKSECMTKEYDTILTRVDTGTRWHFRLTANPTVSCRGEEAKRGKIRACISTDEQRQWLKNKAVVCGFEILDQNFDIVQKEWIRFYKKDTNTKVTLLSVTYEGNLTVTDSKQFIETLCRGVGREKAYGMGLLTISGL